MNLVNLDKEQQYNDAPPGPWTNNVCSSATRGIMLEQAVEDRPPIKSRVVPQFGLSNGRQAAGVNGNTLIECVPVIFDGWKIHHIRFDGAWIRQGTVIFKNAQISGNLLKTLEENSPKNSPQTPLNLNTSFQI